MILAKSPISSSAKYLAIFCTILQDEYLFNFLAQFYEQCGEWIYSDIRSRNVSAYTEFVSPQSYRNKVREQVPFLTNL